ncbi:MAG: hypothetical protein IKW97_04585 [Muribaculaceae bacterium]|nr:hypothetical protein [Muribaculaceae bacterium]
MKKFLFTLTALLLASTAFAGRIYVEDKEFTQAELGQENLLPVYIELDNEYVNGWQLYLTYPEGVTAGTPKKNMSVLMQMVPNKDGDEEPVTPLGDCLANKIVQAYGTAGYWDPNGTGNYESYGAVKIGPTGTFKLYDLKVTPDANFTGGDIEILWMYSGGADARNGQTDFSSAQTHEHNDDGLTSLTVHLTVKQSAFEGTADVTFNGNVATLTYTSNDPDATVEVKVGETATTVTWTYDEATKTYTATYEVEETATEPGEYSVTVTLTVTPSDNFTGEEVSDFDTYTYKVNDELKGDIELGDVTEDGKVTVTYTPGEGDPENVTLDVVVKDEDGNVVENAYADGVITLPDYGEYTVTVTASATDYNDKEFDPETVKWEKKAVDAPVISYETYDTEVVVTISWPESDGEHVYTGLYTYPRTDVDQSFDVEAYVTEGETCQESEHATKTIPVPKKEVIAKPTITFSGEETTTMTITVSCETEGVTLYVNGTAVEGNPYTYTVTRADVYTAGTVNVTAVAKKGDLESETATGSKDWVVQKKDADMPTIEGKVREGSKKYFDIIITPDANTDGKLVYTADPMGTVLGAKAEPVTIQYERGNEDYYVDVTAYTEGTATYNQSETAEARIKVPKLDQVAEPVINYEVNGDKITITTTCGTDDATVVLVGPDGTRYENGTATVTFDPSQGYLETWTATASAQDMLDSETAQKVIDIPALPKTKDPTIDVSFGDADGNTIAYVTFKNNDEKPATIWYSTDNGDTWIKYDPAVPVTFTATDENQEITVLAYAQAEGKLPSDEVDRTFELNNTATSVNELTNGKTVAGVRYFNMAGQEMQEANGITIVVTTYTDGTTSAVKVIK